MADLKRMRRQFVVLASALAVVTIAALVYLLFPIGSSNTELSQELEQTKKEIAIKDAQAQPLRGLPDKLVHTNEDIVKFYRERLPMKQSDVSEELGKLASANGVVLSDVKYEDFDTEIPGLGQVAVEAQLAGEYSKIAKFINAAERDKMFLILNAINLDDQKTGSVRLQIHLETYLRPTFAELAPIDKPAEIKLPAAVKKPNTNSATSTTEKAKP